MKTDRAQHSAIVRRTGDLVAGSRVAHGLRSEPFRANHRRTQEATRRDFVAIATVLGIGALTRDRARIAPMIEGIDPWEWEALDMAAPSGRPIQS